MAIAIGDNIKMNKPLPDFERQEYATFADMKAVKDLRMPDLYLGYCLEDRAYYQYDKQNEVDETLGRWRKFEPGAGTSFQVTVMPEPSATFAAQCVQYLGADTPDYTHGCFYECVSNEGTYTWQALNLSEIASIPNEEIDDLFES